MVMVAGTTPCVDVISQMISFIFSRLTCDAICRQAVDLAADPKTNKSDRHKNDELSNCKCVFLTVFLNMPRLLVMSDVH